MAVQTGNHGNHRIFERTLHSLAFRRVCSHQVNLARCRPDVISVQGNTSIHLSNPARSYPRPYIPSVPPCIGERHLPPLSAFTAFWVDNTASRLSSRGSKYHWKLQQRHCGHPQRVASEGGAARGWHVALTTPFNWSWAWSFSQVYAK